MKKKYLFVILSLLISIYSTGLSAREIKYKTYFGSCPSKVAGDLTLTLLKEFEVSKSLRILKEKIVYDKLLPKYFISSYKIDYDPMTDFLVLSFDCPKPLMKAEVYKEEGGDSYSAILVENGELYDSNYAAVLKAENKLDSKLPNLALPVGEMNAGLQKNIANILKKMSEHLRTKLSEVIISKDKELTMILSYEDRPTSAFLGKDNWQFKISKLNKISLYMEKKGKIPTIVNLTNPKKVVVKFPSKF